MRVLITGASGFIGSHTVKAVLEAGHEVRAAARSTQRIGRALDPLGCANAVEMVTADITSAGQVRDALSGCDAVIHSAAVYSHDARRREQMLTGNPLGTELVLGQAWALGLDPIIHVSSFTALLPARDTLTPDSPVGEPPVPYARSKAHSERIARRLQARGAPVTIVYPGMVWGPDDPASGESTLLARALLGGAIRTGIPGAVPVVDVRDVALVHAAALHPGLGPRRYLAAGENVTMMELQRLISERPPKRPTPAPLVLFISRLADMIQRVSSRRLPFDYEGPWTALHCPTIDTSATARDLGITCRPAAESIRDTLRWLGSERGATASASTTVPGSPS